MCQYEFVIQFRSKWGAGVKRDLELCRQIMLKVEEHYSPTVAIVHVELDGFTADEIGYNTSLLIQAGLVEEWGKGFSNMNNQYECFASNLTWRGHEFLDNARNDNVWNKAKEEIKGKLTTVSFAVLNNLLVKIATDFIHL